MEASYVDLADATHLEFDYMRWLRIVLQAAGARRVLHIGGGACALARALAAADPGGRQEVCEVDADVLTVAREHLGLRRTPGLRVRHVEGRAHIAAQPDQSWDAIVIDAFVGVRVPPRLVTVEAMIEAARVAPLTLVNVVDNRSANDVRAVASAVALAYPVVWTLGPAGRERDRRRVRDDPRIQPREDRGACRRRPVAGPAHHTSAGRADDRLDLTAAGRHVHERSARIAHMKAAVIHENGGPEVLRYQDVPDPECPDGCVVVDAEAISIEGGDLLARAGGDLPAAPAHRRLSERRGCERGRAPASTDPLSATGWWR